MGYIGSKEAAPILLQGLEHLEYRGYDSAGIAVVNGEGLVAVHKAPGKLSALVKSLNGTLPLGVVGIGHTRWATHGSPNEVNAHPHGDCNRDVVIVHNGIVENYLSLKQQLQEDGHRFSSQTDTEVIAHLVESFMAEGASLEEAVALSARAIKGAQAVVAMLASRPDRLVAFRFGECRRDHGWLRRRGYVSCQRSAPPCFPTPPVSSTLARVSWQRYGQTASTTDRWTMAS